MGSDAVAKEKVKEASEGSFGRRRERRGRRPSKGAVTMQRA